MGVRRARSAHGHAKSVRNRTAGMKSTGDRPQATTCRFRASMLWTAPKASTDSRRPGAAATQQAHAAAMHPRNRSSGVRSLLARPFAGPRSGRRPERLSGPVPRLLGRLRTVLPVAAVTGLIALLTAVIPAPPAQAAVVTVPRAATRAETHAATRVETPAQTPAEPEADRGNSWGWPLGTQPPVLRRFERPARRWAPGHRGVDLLGRAGAPVRAAGEGTVAFVGSVAGRPVVAVQHGPMRTTYEPVLASVTTGQHVRAGTVLGRLTGVGSHCRPRACLHWGLKRGEEYLDPLVLVRRGPPRLLPLWDGSGRRALMDAHPFFADPDRGAGPQPRALPRTAAGPRIRAGSEPDRRPDTDTDTEDGTSTAEGTNATLAAGAVLSGGVAVAGTALMVRRRLSATLGRPPAHRRR